MRNPILAAFGFAGFLYLGQKVGFGNLSSMIGNFVAFAFLAIAGLIAYRIGKFIYLNFKGALARRDDNTFDISNERLAHMISEQAQEELMDSHTALGIHLEPTLQEDDGEWRSFFLKVHSDALDEYEQASGRNHGLVIRVHNGRKKYYTIMSLRGSGNSLQKLEAMHDGSLSRGVDFMVSRARSLNSDAIELLKVLPRAARAA